MKQFVLKVSEIFPDFDFLGSRDSGEKLREELAKHIDLEEQVILDFSGIQSISHSFADEVFGLLYVKFDLDTLRKYIRFQNVEDKIRNMANFAIRERVRKCPN